jgi:hypothetical protein
MHIDQNNKKHYHIAFFNDRFNSEVFANIYKPSFKGFLSSKFFSTIKTQWLTLNENQIKPFQNDISIYVHFNRKTSLIVYIA